MSFLKYKELNLILSLEDVNKEIFILQKNLFDLRLKRAANKSILPHLFKHTKRKLAQLKFKRSILLKSKS
jgi:ribosomal protein L29